MIQMSNRKFQQKSIKIRIMIITKENVLMV